MNDDSNKNLIPPSQPSMPSMPSQQAAEASDVYDAYKDRKVPKVLKGQVNWEGLYFYRKSDVLYQMTYVFCRRFLPVHGDRTVDQMVQAARSGKQNIVEGSADGSTSTEMELKLLNVARASIHELREDYRDFLLAHRLDVWEAGHERYQPMLDFCKVHNDLPDYEKYFEKWGAETMANVALTLCHMIDAMMNSYIAGKEAQFVKEGGIKERMYAARTGYRKGQDERLAALEKENEELRREVERLKAELRKWEGDRG